jgi:deoxycytidine triphosphate deaminase
MTLSQSCGECIAFLNGDPRKSLLRRFVLGYCQAIPPGFCGRAGLVRRHATGKTEKAFEIIASLLVAAF